MSEKLFIICVNGTYGGEDYYIVKAPTKEVAITKANLKFDSLKDTLNTLRHYMGTPTEIEFDADGVSQLLANIW